MKIMWARMQAVQPFGAIRLGFEGLDFVDLRDTFRVSAHVMKIAPGFLKGPYRSATRWREAQVLRTGVVPKGKLQEHFAVFESEGVANALEWTPSAELGELFGIGRSAMNCRDDV